MVTYRALSSLMFRALILVLLLTSVIVAAGHSSASPMPNGLYGLMGWDQSPIPPALLADSSVSGIAIRLSWGAMEPSDGAIDFSVLDSEIAAARAAGKTAFVSIMAGYTTPAWVYANGAQSVSFVWTKPSGPPKGSTQYIPVPWDPVFLSAWTGFVDAVVARYANDPAVTVFKVTGINFQDEQTSLPTSTVWDNPSGDANLLSAWNTIVAHWTAGGKPVAPMFNQSGFSSVPGPNLTNQMIQAAVSDAGPLLIAQNNLLSPGSNWLPKVAVPAIAYQAGAPFHTVTAADSAFSRAEAAHALYVEVYQSDLENPALAKTIATAAQVLGGGGGPTPTPTASPSPTPTRTASPTPSPTPTPTSTSSPTPTPTSTITGSPSPTPTPIAGLNFSHVFVVEEENNTYSMLVGNKLMPYLNSLMQQYALSTGYYANTHGSITDYFWMITGQAVTKAAPTNVDNIVRQLTTNGLSWRAYAEGLPSIGYLGGSVGNYAAGHNPFVFLTDVRNSSAQAANVLPFTSFATDLNTYNFANANFITPDLCDDLHANAGCANGCTKGSLPACYTAGDNWLKTNLGPLIATPEFQAHDLLIIWTDEAAFNDSTHGGGQVAWVAISGRSKAGPIKATTLEQHQNTLALICSALGTSACPGAAQRAWPMSEYFN